ncbi:M15 family metallopeptidase [Streptomyces sp. MB09-01]|uniref:M15 family metallopeptidase n=1 Tax=Streptomyces sp. MB09-01 TaxID=3028666 RepID=UPI0029A4BC5E|nr:M15 family metallopeptidase [Streptomyces sp. MB09-01]MDX3540621.1 M15 family metallopeptidase [Streptomyces sp. MB09-01]
MKAVVGVLAVLAGGAAAASGSGQSGQGFGHGSAHGFVALREVDPSVRQDMRYAGARNFTGGVVDGYEEPVCLLARPAAEALRRAQRGLLRRGYALRVYDCYRPQRAVDRFVRWAREADGPHDRAAKTEFYPNVERNRLIPEGYIAEKSGHSRGSTLDVTLEELSGRPVDMATAFDFFDPLSHTDDPRVTGAARAHRQLLKGVLAEQGFVNLPEEWWHFTYKPEAYPDTYFDFPVAVASVRP